jgi:myo-inositol-1(or 4)-monophosphatase
MVPKLEIAYHYKQMQTSPKELLEFAKCLAKKTAPLTSEGANRVQTRRKGDQTIVTEIDLAVQEVILREIAAQYPEHAVIAEETIAQPHAHAGIARAKFCWVIDPVDGTRNFAVNFPCFATSIALLEDGEPLVGVVIEHNLGRIYAAARGLGATVDQRPLRAAEPQSDDDWLIGVASNRDPATIAVVHRLLETRGWILRNTGSTAFHLALVASGALTGAYCNQCKIWDIAAGILLVSEAGRIMTDPAGGALVPFSLTGDMTRNLPFLAGSRISHPVLLNSLKKSLFQGGG